MNYTESLTKGHRMRDDFYLCCYCGENCVDENPVWEGFAIDIKYVCMGLSDTGGQRFRFCGPVCQQKFLERGSAVANLNREIPLLLQEIKGLKVDVAVAEEQAQRNWSYYEEAKDKYETLKKQVLKELEDEMDQEKHSTE